MVKCPKCGYSDPFIPSWYDPEKNVCEHWSCQEWDPELWSLLQEKDVRRVEGDGVEYLYHKTPKSVERWGAWNWDNRKNRIKGYYDSKTGRKNYHLLGRKLARRGKIKNGANLIEEH